VKTPPIEQVGMAKRQQGEAEAFKGN